MDAKRLLDRCLQAGIGAVASQGKSASAALGARDGLEAIESLARLAWSEGGEDAWSVSPVRRFAGDIPPLSEDGRAQVLLQAIIAAAKVDGRLGEAEQERVLAMMEPAQLTDDETAYLREELRHPPVLDHMARRLTTRAETVEVYAASLLALDPDHPVSRHYLDMLAARLGLERALVDRIEATVAAHR